MHILAGFFTLLPFILHFPLFLFTPASSLHHRHFLSRIGLLQGRFIVAGRFIHAGSLKQECPSLLENNLPSKKKEKNGLKKKDVSV